MGDMGEDARLHAPAAERNRGPILEVLERVLPEAASVLEIGSGSGMHGAFMCEHLPQITWQPSDPVEEHRASIAAWRRAAQLSNLKSPIELDASALPWEVGPHDAVVCINVFHITPIEVTHAVIDGATQVLPPDGVLYTYGPYMREGEHTSESNAKFDAMLRSRDPRWGVRDVKEVSEIAAASGLFLREVVDMPANNLSLVFRKDTRR